MQTPAPAHSSLITGPALTPTEPIRCACLGIQKVAGRPTVPKVPRREKDLGTTHRSQPESIAASLALRPASSSLLPHPSAPPCAPSPGLACLRLAPHSNQGLRETREPEPEPAHPSGACVPSPGPLTGIWCPVFRAGSSPPCCPGPCSASTVALSVIPSPWERDFSLLPPQTVLFLLTCGGTQSPRACLHPQPCGRRHPALPFQALLLLSSQLL